MIFVGICINFLKVFGFMGMFKVVVKYLFDKYWSFCVNYLMGYCLLSIKELFFNWDYLGMFMICGNENM